MRLDKSGEIKRLNAETTARALVLFVGMLGDGETIDDHKEAGCVIMHFSRRLYDFGLFLAEGKTKSDDGNAATACDVVTID